MTAPQLEAPAVDEQGPDISELAKMFAQGQAEALPDPTPAILSAAVQYLSQLYNDMGALYGGLHQFDYAESLKDDEELSVLVGEAKESVLALSRKVYKLRARMLKALTSRAPSGPGHTDSPGEARGGNYM